MLYNLWIFDEKGSALYYREWQRRKHANMDRDEEAKLLYGMLFSVKSFVNKLSPVDMKDGFLSYKTNKYRLNYLETPTGTKFVLNTDVNVTHPIVRDLLHKIYSQIFVEYAVKSPLYELGEPIKSELFTAKLDDLVKGTPLFKSLLMCNGSMIPKPSQMLTPAASYASEIQSMMHAFGDCSLPLADTAAVLEEIVKSQMREILALATDVCARRNGPVAVGPVVVSLEDLVFVMRKSPIKVQRLVRYLTVKDTAASVSSACTGEVGSIGQDHRRVKRCRDFLARIDTNGILIKACHGELYDDAREERLKRLDRISRSLNEKKYVEFAKARQINFVGYKMRHQQKFYDWLTKDMSGWSSDMKIDKIGMDVLAYLAYETVGQIVEMSLLVRTEAIESADAVQRHVSSSLSFNPRYPNVQLGLGSHAAEESPLRKRLKSGSAAGGENAAAPTPAPMAAAALAPALLPQQPSTLAASLDLSPLRPAHAREAFRRLTQMAKTPATLWTRADKRHQACQVAPHIVAI